MSIPQVESINVTQQHLEQSPTTFCSRLAKGCFSVKGVALLGTAAFIATAIYLTTHKSTTESDDDFPHDSVFSFYCKESCSLLYKLNPGLMESCKEYCANTSANTSFPNACILACNKLGMSVLTKCIRSCK